MPNKLQNAILRLAIPNIISNISIPLLGIVDTALMGHLGSELYLGAIALGSVVFSFLYWGFGFLRMGTTGMTAQAYGKEDEEETLLILSRALTVAVLGSLLAILLQGGVATLAFGLLKGDDAVKELAKEYFFIRIWAAPATIGLYAFHGWFLGMQNARFPLYLSLTANLLNIGFNCLFLFGFGMKSDGVAWGTVCAQYAALSLALILFASNYRHLLPKLQSHKILQLDALGHFFSVNTDIFIRTICLVGVFGFFSSESSGMDVKVLAANQILLQYFHILSYAVDGFAYAAESLVGRLHGADDQEHLQETIRQLLRWGLGAGLGFALVYLALGRPLLWLFTDQVELVERASRFLWWLAPISLAGAWAFIWDGVFIGLTATKAMRNSVLIATFGIFLPAYYLGSAYVGGHALWLALLLFMCARGAGLWWVYQRKFI